jgi:hypothetical protein
MAPGSKKVVRLSVHQTVAYTEIVTAQNKDILISESDSGYLRSFLVYMGKQTFLKSPRIPEDAENSSDSSETL